ncbi:MAG TPA: hypothetical protein PK400_00255 [Phycisphaerales bacterium]|nr:hypothetical protein [Phycisphaerales bacterium]HRQ75156.1 hypothetical protein [Phycisphaerales bacterium]
MLDAYADPRFAFQPTPTNSLGTAGLIISLIGLVLSAGLLSPVGMVISFVAMFREPRGLAFAGFILGVIGSAWLLVLGFILAIALAGSLLGGF